MAALDTTLRRADQQEPAAAADVEHLLVAPPGDAVEHLLALVELAAAAAPDHPRRGEEEAGRRPAGHLRDREADHDVLGRPPHELARHQAHPRREREQQRGEARDREVADDAGSVLTVVGAFDLRGHRSPPPSRRL